MPSATANTQKSSAKAKQKPANLHFLIHDKKDDVGVAVIDIKKGQEVSGLTLDTRSKVAIKSLASIPLGHKIALRDFKNGDTITKYGQDIGKVVAPIKKGDHVHVHNVKTKRW